MRIRVIDNDSALRRSLNILLRQQGHDIDCFENPVAASELTQRSALPEAQILDSAMPELNTDQIAIDELNELGVRAFPPKPLALDRRERIVARSKIEGPVASAELSMDSVPTRGEGYTRRARRDL